MQRKTLMVAAAVTAAALVAATAVMLADPELRSQALLALAPARFRDAALERFIGSNGEEVYVLGTVGERHLTASDYSLRRLRALLTRLRPDVALVELAAQEGARGKAGAGEPIEALYAARVAPQLDVAALGFGAADAGASDDRLFANAQAVFAGHRKVLILVGHAHLAGFADRLRMLGFRRAGLSGAEKAALFDVTGVPASFPPGLASDVERRLAADRAARKRERDAERLQRLDQAILAHAALLRTIRASGDA